MSCDDLVLTPTGLRFRGRVFACAIGRGGVTGAKREGDGATPAGTHRITGMMYRPDRVARAAVPGWAVPIGPRDLWCDDPARPEYNDPVRAPFGGGHERLRRPDPLYDIVLITDYNRLRAVRGAGSAIFVHVWRAPRHPTAGCVALRRAHLLWIVRRLAAGTRLVVGAGALRDWSRRAG